MQMCLINAAHEHFITQTGEKSKKHVKKFMLPGYQGDEGREIEIPRKIFRLFCFVSRHYLYISTIVKQRKVVRFEEKYSFKK